MFHDPPSSRFHGRCVRPRAHIVVALDAYVADTLSLISKLAFTGSVVPIAAGSGEAVVMRSMPRPPPPQPLETAPLS